MATTITAGDLSNPAIISSDTTGAVVIQTGAAGAKVNALSLAADGTPTFLKGPTSSTVRLNTANGYGSTNTVIRRYTNVVTNQGSDITYADSATAGASFTINTAGVYAISITDNFTSGTNFGVSLNSSQLTTEIGAITATDRLAAGTSSGVGTIMTVATTVYLPAGSVIRPHAGATAASSAANCQFTITRVA